MNNIFKKNIYGYYWLGGEEYSIEKKYNRICVCFGDNLKGCGHGCEDCKELYNKTQDDKLKLLILLTRYEEVYIT